MGERPGARRTVVTAAIVAGLLAWPLARPIVDLGAVPAVPASTQVLEIVRAVHAAQKMYRSAHGYYDRLECLVQDACVPNPYPPTYLPAPAARPIAYGYRLRLVEGSRVRLDTTEFVSPTGMTAYAFVAVPAGGAVAPPRQPSYCTDADGIYLYADGRAPVIDGARCLHRDTPVF